MADCQRRESNREKCTCTNDACDNHGICCLCVENHRSQGQLPACLRELAQK
ncbi:MAG TPA: DUF6485 family protein [Phycisphaerae bacterium]|nr:DUF6485 family protein [Phycisphaerae bacterium]